MPLHNAQAATFAKRTAPQTRSRKIVAALTGKCAKIGQIVVLLTFVPIKYNKNIIGKRAHEEWIDSAHKAHIAESNQNQNKNRTTNNALDWKISNIQRTACITIIIIIIDLVWQFVNERTYITIISFLFALAKRDAILCVCTNAASICQLASPLLFAVCPQSLGIDVIVANFHCSTRCAEWEKSSDCIAKMRRKCWSTFSECNMVAHILAIHIFCGPNSASITHAIIIVNFSTRRSIKMICAREVFPI